MMGWAVNSIAKAVEGSIPFLPINCKRVAHYSLAILNKKKKTKCAMCFALHKKVCDAREIISKSLYSSTVEQNTVNILIDVQFILRA